jgi:tetratricopeptide (TPR) repeat protein
MTYYKSNELAKALKLFDECIIHFDTIVNLSEKCWVQVGKAKVLKKLGRPDEAISVLKETLQVVLHGGYSRYLEEIYATLQELYREVNELDSAIKYLDLKYAMIDSLRGAEIQTEISRQVADFELKQQHYRDSLEHARLLAADQASAARANRIQYSAIIIFVFLLGSIIAISGRFKIRPRIATALIFIFFILLFEFILVVMDPFVEAWSEGQVGIKLAVNSLLPLSSLRGTSSLKEG